MSYMMRPDVGSSQASGRPDAPPLPTEAERSALRANKNVGTSVRAGGMSWSGGPDLVEENWGRRNPLQQLFMQNPFQRPIPVANFDNLSHFDLLSLLLGA